MADPRLERLEDLFHRAADLTTSERASFLSQECDDDPPMRAELEAMLVALDQGTQGLLAGTAVPNAASLDPVLPSHLGAYRIIRLLGEGGMGTVYEAEQSEPRRTVALKVVRPGLMSPTMLRRFRQESQILGQLKHVGIAQIYEAGAIELPPPAVGVTPYFAMELVVGAPLLDYANESKLGTRERLALIAKLCDAVAHAHQRGVIHRDLKPANVLVESSAADLATNSDRRHAHSSLVDSWGGGQPKILDFGIARAIDVDTHRVTLHTDVGQIVGTLAYMSPEQAVGDPAKVDARSDVYALGVILYELLAGRLPLEVAGRPIPDAARLIREEEPTRLGSINVSCRGDVETIVAKALDKDPTRRYQSAAELGADIRRYLRDEPIVARPTSTLYQLRKFARRHRGLVTGIIVAFLALLLGFAGVSYLAVKERQQRHTAERRAYRAGIAAAQAALEKNDATLACAALDAVPTEHIGWEWRYLDHKARSAIMRFRADPLSTLGRVAVNAGGTLLALSSPTHPNSIRLWNAATGEHIRDVPIDEGGVSGVSLSADAGRMLLTRATGRIELWSLFPDKKLWVTDPIGSWPASISADGRRVAYPLSTSKEVLILDADSGAPIRRLPFESLSPSPVFSHDGKLLGVTGASPGGYAAIFDLETGQKIWTAQSCTFHAFSPDGRRAVLTRRAIPRGQILMIDTSTGAELLSMALADRGIGSGVIYRPDGNAVILRPGDEPIMLVLDANTFDAIATLDPRGEIMHISYTADSSRLMTVDADGLVTTWNGLTPPMPMQVPFHRGTYAAVVSNERNALFTAEWGAVSCWNLSTGDLTWMRPVSIRNVRAIALSPDTDLLAADLGSGAVGILNAATGAWVTRSRPDVARDIASLHWSRDGIGVSFDDGVVELRSATDPTIVARTYPGCAGAVRQLTSTPDGKFVVGIESAISERRRPRTTSAAPESSAIGGVHLWDAHTGAVARIIAGGDLTIRCVAFTPDARLLAMAGADKEVRIYNPSTGAVARAPLIGATSDIQSLSFSPDRSRIAAGCSDGAIHLWDLETGETTAILRADRNIALAFAGEDGGDRLIACGVGAFTVFESRFPSAETLRRREHMRQARAWVDPLILEGLPHEQRLAAAVLQQIRAQPGISAATRDAAIDFLVAGGEHAATVNSSAWGLVRPPGENHETYQTGLRLAEAALNALPDAPATLNTYATALYRTGQYAKAITYFKRAIDRCVADGLPPYPSDYALLACCLAETGDLAQARQSLDQARRITQESSFMNDEDTRNFLIEAEKTLGAQRAPEDR